MSEERIIYLLFACLAGLAAFLIYDQHRGIRRLRLLQEDLDRRWRKQN